jgi:Ca-activated chloride channel family protein
MLMKLLRGMELLGVFCLFAAAAGPVLVSGETVWLNRGADILFVLDVSPSMAGLDMEGRSRFDAARELVRDFALRRPYDALGLAAAGSDAALLVPPTIDRETFLGRLDSLRIGEMGDGTALGMGLAIAAMHTSRSAAPRRAVVLITDGENNAGAVHPETAAALFPALGVSLYVIGLGSGGEVPVNYVDPVTKIRRTGVLDSRFDPETLKTIAQKGGGTWLSAPSAEAFYAAFLRLDQEEMIVGRSASIARTRSIRRPFILGALLLLALAWFVRRVILGELC